ncbi:uncharacterized protein C6orf47 homolog [Pelodytes ibericus]
MFLHRSMQWPSPPAFFSKFLRSSSSPPPDPHSPPQKPKRWRLPSISLPAIPNLRSFLLYSKKDGNPKFGPSNINIEHFQICINLVHHLIDICILGCLWLFSPVFRVTLDVFGIQGAIKLWIHGLAIFLATTYGMYLLLWLAQEYLFQLASLYGILQTLVLMVSLKAEREEEMAREEAGQEDEVEEGEGGDGGRREEEEEEEELGERGQMEDRWAGGSEDEAPDSEDEWVSDGEEEEIA